MAAETPVAASTCIGFKILMETFTVDVQRADGRIAKRVDYEDKGSDFANIQVATERGLQVFTFKQLHSATGGFGKSNVIGHGGLGLVYRGVLQDGRKVAVKLMDQAGKQGEEEFKIEVEHC
ncbi:hypothetical protein F0562_025031 [Nyssa sinensis]|uniref:Protein kinase domain-containing protein n=1 Tax=Nyssa sinensis TaxID=561372 RepID=A0A5J5BEN0_9ASTE|nr:hypothetical protein F0562_025031 [Nyssa sinensis]